MHEALTHVDLLSGIGGFSIAAESVGFKTVAFYETDPAASIVLEYWWPEVRNHGDIRGINSASVTMPGRPDLLTAGVPCQPTSHVGQRLGSSDPRWMWPATIRGGVQQMADFMLEEESFNLDDAHAPCQSGFCE